MCGGETKKATYLGGLPPTQEEYATVRQATSDPLASPFLPTSNDVIASLIRDGARSLLAAAIEDEVSQHLAARRELVDERGHRLVVRNGRCPERSILTPVGPIPVRAPRVRDHRPPESRETFRSRYLPPYMRRSTSIEELVPFLVLAGVSTNDIADSLRPILGAQAEGLSPSTVGRMIEIWRGQHREWSSRPLAGKHYVYVWADGVYFNIRMEDADNRRQCILLLMGATAEGKKELIAITDGYRESAENWKELLLDVKRRGLAIEPSLAVADGSLGFWAALAEVWPSTKTQRCWVHKTANVLTKLPKSLHPRAKEMIHAIWMAPGKAEAEKALDAFVAAFTAKYPKAAECIDKDRDKLLTFYDFPAEHWSHIRTTNPIESTFATIRTRHDKTKQNCTRAACLAMVFKLAHAAQRHWRKLNASRLLGDVVAGVLFQDGIIQSKAA